MWDFAASALFHGALIAAFFLVHPAPELPSPPLYRVQLLAAPTGERAIGAVQNKPSPTSPKPQPVTPPLKAVALKLAPKVHPTKTKPRTIPIAVTPTPLTPAKPQNAAPLPVAGGGPTGGKGADVASVSTGAIDFPYPLYTQRIVRELILRFGPTSSRFTAVVRFVIHRDGSVTDIDLLSSDDYTFGQRARGAVESAARANAFGTLPPGFREDILPVTFRFTPDIR